MRPEFAFIGKNSAVYMIDGHAVTNPTVAKEKWFYIPGKRENTRGVAILNTNHIDNSYEKALQLFKRSAQLGYAPGQTNLAEIYLTDVDLERNGNVEKTAHWLFQAALQGYQPAVDKYQVICELDKSCTIDDFYQALNKAGINLRVN